MDKPFSSWVQWDNTMCNPLAPAREQTQSAWQHGYESGFVDGMSRQAQSSVDKGAGKREWQGLDEVEIVGATCECVDDGTFNMDCAMEFARAIESKLKERNT